MSAVAAGVKLTIRTVEPRTGTCRPEPDSETSAGLRKRASTASGGVRKSKTTSAAATRTPVRSATAGAVCRFEPPPQPAASATAASATASLRIRGRLAHVADAPGPSVPFPPMEAELVAELPGGGGWRYEPKWDGFRGVLENDGGELALWSRNGRPLLRYFPELRPLGEQLPPHSALDGEIVIARGGALDFDAMQMRLHPAESRVRKLSAEIPATFVAFDLLLWKGKPIHERPIERRRAELEKVAAGTIQLSPVSDDVEQGRDWLQT